MLLATVMPGLTALVGSAYENKFLTLQPTYTISDWAKAKPVVDKMVASAKKETGVIYCGYSTTRSLRSTSTVGGYAVTPGDKLFGRLAFPDADALLSHLQNRDDTALQSGAASLDSLAVHGPAGELAKLSIDGADYYETEAGISRLERETGGAQLPLQLLSVHTSFDVSDPAAAKLICDELVERTATEPDCLYCGWTRRDDRLFLREAFGSVVGIARHADNVGSCLEALAGGDNAPAVLVDNEVHASLANLNLYKEFVTDTQRDVGYCSASSVRYFSEGGFSRYDVQQSLFGFFFRR
jgi:hypothetical protein